MTERKYVEPINTHPAEFPEDQYIPEGAKVISLKDDTKNVMYHHDVIYAEQNGMKLRLQILVPRPSYILNMFVPETTEVYPLIVYIPGSAFGPQDNYRCLPMLIDFARKGYVIASVEYRPSNVAVFPAQIEDAKTAIRFMRKNAAKYHVNPEKIALWGDSSGGHTAVGAGITGSEELDIEIYKEYSAKVNCIVDWYGPTAINRMNEVPSACDHYGPYSPEGKLIGEKNVLEYPELAEAVNPVNYLKDDKEIPPILIMHGNRDMLVPFHQSVILYEALKDLKKDVEFYILKNANHGFYGFMCQECFEIVEEFIKRKLCERDE